MRTMPTPYRPARPYTRRVNRSVRAACTVLVVAILFAPAPVRGTARLGAVAGGPHLASTALSLPASLSPSPTPTPSSAPGAPPTSEPGSKAVAGLVLLALLGGAFLFFRSRLDPGGR